jgi:hypothetical protein
MPKRCLSCGQPFESRPQSPLQEYCSEKTCQKERRRRWQLNKRHTDPDYKDNQIRAQQAWADANPNYWRDYRSSHPEYVENNRAKQRRRSQRSASEILTEMHTPSRRFDPKGGLYLLIDESSDDVAKKDAWLVRLTLVSAFKVEKNS